MQSVGRAPLPLWIIALAALSPFPVAAGIYAFGPAGQASMALAVILTWSAVVLAFLGGVRWGLETGRPSPRWPRLLASVISPVIAWILFLGRDAIADHWELTGFLAAFLLQWLFDHSAPDTPARWPILMTTLTLGACVSLAVVLEKALQM